MARPTIRTRAIEETILSRLVTGSTRRAACAEAGISYSTLYLWLSEGKKEDAPEEHKKFNLEVEEACARAEIRWVGAIEAQARNGDWRAYAWLLERRFPEDWRQRKDLTIEAEVKSDGTAEVLGMMAQLQISLDSPGFEDTEPGVD
tara:strand:- start:133 stop:570 length:438 start_codon:yes stop_codon:yes gene_type:complete